MKLSKTIIRLTKIMKGNNGYFHLELTKIKKIVYLK